MNITPPVRRPRQGDGPERGLARLAGRLGTRPVAVFVVSFLAFLALSSLWAVTTPIGASPDEPAHYIKAASTVRGQLIGEPGPRPQDKVVQVPENVADTGNVMCMAYDPSTTADCLPPFGSDRDLVDSTTSAGLYNPVYYVLVGWPSLLEMGKGSLFLMRFVSAALCAFFLASAVTALSRLPRPTLPVLAVFAVSTPMTYFLMGSVNPNALEISTTAAFFSTLLLATTTPVPAGPGRWLVAGSLALSGGLLVQARGLSPVWLGLAVLVVAVWVGVPAFLRRVLTPPYLVSVVAVAVSTALAVVWTLRSGSLNAVGVYSGAGTSTAQGFVRMVETSTDYVAQAAGNFGWLDTPAPGYVAFVYSGLLGLLVVSALLFGGRTRAGAAVWVALASAVVIPAAVQASSVTESGYIWQGRYSLPAVVVLVLVAAVAASGRFDRLPVSEGRRVVLFLLAATAFVQAASALTALKRYSVGLWTSWAEMFSAPVWHPPLLGVGPWAVSVVAVVVVVSLSAYLVVPPAVSLDPGVPPGEPEDGRLESGDEVPAWRS
jgi:hypothetical protein